MRRPEQPLPPATERRTRLWSTAHPDLLVAPRWQSISGQLSQHLQRLMVERDIRQGQEVGSEGCLRE
jgi:hypothetical protein